jgi:hypothetical protein
MQSWVNKYRRGLSKHPCGTPVLRISEVEVLFPTFTTWGAARHEVPDPVAQGGVQTQGPELNDELGGSYGVEGLAIVNDQYSDVGIPLVQGSMQCDGNCIICGSIGAVSKLKWV